jgi:hypothetical protein
VCLTSAAVKSKGEELHVNILTACIPDNVIITWRRSATPKTMRGSPAKAIKLSSVSDVCGVISKSRHMMSEAEL